METGATVHFVLMLFLTPISFGAMAAVLIWFFTQKSDTAQADRVEQIWAQRESWGEPLCRQLINFQIAPKMTPEMVTLAWGSPETINRQPGQNEELWHYKNGSRINFSDGLVTQFDGPAPATSRKNPVWLYIGLLFALAIVVSVITLLVIYLAR